jgi:hypothetical protein
LPRLMPAAARRYLIALPRLPPAAPLIMQILDRGAQDAARGVLVVHRRAVFISCGAQALSAAALVVRRRYFIVTPGCCPWRAGS